MSWKNRKLFNNLPQGIVSGLEPIPRYKEGGFVNPRNYIGGGTVEYPIGMEAGSLVPKENFMERGINSMLESLGIETDANKVRQNKRDKAKRKIRADIEANNFVKNLMAEYMDGTKTGGDFIKEYGGIGDLKLRYIEKKYPDVYEDFYSNQLGLNSKLNRATETFDQAIGMEMGSLVPEVFESGDQQINEALNTMISTTMPTSDAVPSMAIEEPTGDVAEIIPKTTTGDSSSKESLFIAELNEQKKVLQDTIEKVVAEKTQEGLDPITLESQITDFITKADSLFKRKVTEIANKLNVEVMPEQITLLTDDFSTKLETMFPSIAALDSDEDMQVVTAEESDIVTMEHGGVVNAAAIKDNETKIAELNAKLGPMPSDTKRQRRARLQIENQIRKLQRDTELLRHPLAGRASNRDKNPDPLTSPTSDSTTTTPETNTNTGGSETVETSTVTPDLRELLANNARDIEAAALMTGKSKQGGVSGFMDVLGQANLLGAKAERENLLNELKVQGQTELLGQKADIDLFNQLADLSGIDYAKEQLLLSGKALPATSGLSFPLGKVALQGGKVVDFKEYLRIIRSNKDKKINQKTYAQIEADFNVLPRA